MRKWNYTWRVIVALAFVVVAVNPMSSYCQYVPPASGPACAACGTQGGGNPNCSACGGGGGGGRVSDPDAPQGDPLNAPIIAFPIGIIGGVFMGGGWFYDEMAGKNPKVSGLKTYQKAVSLTNGDPNFNKPFNAGATLGGLPWLVLYAPAWPIRQGVVALIPEKEVPPSALEIALAKKLTTRREELYRIQADQTEITKRLNAIAREFSTIGTDTQKIIEKNYKRIPETVAGATGDILTSKRKILSDEAKSLFEKIKDHIDFTKTVKSYSDIQEADSWLEHSKKTIDYISMLKSVKVIPEVNWAIKASEPWVDVFSEYKFLQRLPELELQHRALVLDMEAIHLRRKDVMREMESLQKDRAAVSGKPLKKIEVSPLRPKGLGSYVPPLFPTERSLKKIRQ
jgi:hypothetical protein